MNNLGYFSNISLAATSYIHLKAGTADVAPFSFTSGTLTTGTNIRAGQVEFLNDAYYGTITTGPARRTFAFLESPIFTGTVELPVIKITTGASLGYFLTSGADGTASWAAINQMVYPSAGIPISTGTAWGTSITNNSANWNTAYDDRFKWDGGSTGLTASTGRTSLGATTIGASLFTLTNPSAITFPRFNADNTVSALSASDFRTAIGVTASQWSDEGLTGNIYVTSKKVGIGFSNPSTRNYAIQVSATSFLYGMLISTAS